MFLLQTARVAISEGSVFFWKFLPGPPTLRVGMGWRGKKDAAVMESGWFFIGRMTLVKDSALANGGRMWLALTGVKPL